MPKEYDRIPIDEVVHETDAYRHARCGVCGHPLVGSPENGGRDHPPGTLWSILPGPPPPETVHPACYAVLSPGEAHYHGITLTPCAGRHPTDPAPPPPDHDPRKLRRFPGDVTPPGKTPAPLLPRGVMEHRFEPDGPDDREYRDLPGGGLEVRHPMRVYPNFGGKTPIPDSVRDILPSPNGHKRES
jgi:hypothetical protein